MAEKSTVAEEVAEPQFVPEYNSPEYTETPEFEIRDDSQQLPTRSTRLLEIVRLGLNVLNLCIGISIVGVSADAIAVFNNTHLSADYLLPLWPYNFNLGPSIAVVVGGAIIVVSSVVSLAAGQVPALRAKSRLHAILSILAPACALVAAIIATSFFYAVNASETVDSLQSWSCRWSYVTMDSSPHFGKLCDESQASLYMIIVMIPLEVIVLSLGIMVIATERAARAANGGHGKMSPAMS